MPLVTSRFTTDGLHCPSCARLVQMAVGDLEGVSSVSADFQSGLTEVAYDDALVGPGRIIEAIVEAGYGARLAADV